MQNENFSQNFLFLQITCGSLEVDEAASQTLEIFLPYG